MQQPSVSCIESRIEKDNSLYGRFLIGPFLFGQGLTIGNALRRSLLSELPGVAITAIEIDGINHEYSTIRGVRESVLDILLNIKQIVLTSNVPIEEPQLAFLECSGSTIVLAKDIKFPNSIQCINPDQYIAALSFDGILRIKFFICRGKNQTNNTTAVDFDEVNNSFNKKEKKKLSTSFQKKVLSKFSEGSFSEKRIEDYSTRLNENESKKSLLTLSRNKVTQSTEVSLIKKLLIQNNYTKTKIKLQKEKISQLYLKTLSKEKQRVPQRETSSGKQVNKEIKKKTLQPLNYLRKNEILEISSQKQKFSFTKIRGFDQIEKNENLAKEKGSLLFINPFFVPVKKVNFLLETDDDLQKSRDRIILEIWTNGSILPSEAVKHAAKAVINLFEPLMVHFFFLTFFPIQALQKIFITRFNTPKKKTMKGFDKPFHLTIISRNNFWYNLATTKKILEREVKKKSILLWVDKLQPTLPLVNSTIKLVLQKVKRRSFEKTSNKKLDLYAKTGLTRFIHSFDLANIGLSYRSYTCLKRAGLETVGDFLKFPQNELVLLKKFGKRELDEIQRKKKIITIVSLNKKPCVADKRKGTN